jgi:4-amino-4-deoxy-L-arabinose transferase-like glycosyltransferase
MRGLFSAFPWDRREARYAVVALALAVTLLLLFVIPAPRRDIEAQVELRGLDPGQDLAVTVSDGQAEPLAWDSQNVVSLTVVAPRRALITVATDDAAYSFTIHELILYREKEWAEPAGLVSAEIIGGRVVEGSSSLPHQVHLALYENRFVFTLLFVFSLAYLCTRRRATWRPLAPWLIVCSLLVYQLLFFFDLTPTLYWDTPLLDPFVRSCLLLQMGCSALLVAVWFPARSLVSRWRPDLADGAERIVDRYGLIILLALPLAQHLVGHGVFGYNLQPTDARYTYMDWGRAMLDKGLLSFLSRGLLRRMETPLLAAVWALFYRVTQDGYLASALVPMIYSEIAIVGTYLLAKEFLGRGMAFYAGLFLALSPVFSFASYFVMNDVASAAMTVLTLWLFVVAVKRESLLLGMASGLCLFLTTITKLTGVYCAFLVVVVYWFSATQKKRILVANLAFLALLPIAFVTPYVMENGVSWAALEDGREHLVTWAKRPMFQDRDDEPAGWNDMILQSGQTHYYMGPVPRTFYFQYLANAMGFPILFWIVMILVGALEARLMRSGENGACPSLVKRKLWALALWALPLLVFLSLWSMRNTRFSYIAFPAYAMLGACGFLHVKRYSGVEGAGHSGLLLGLSVIMLSTQSLAHYYNVSYLENADYRDPVFIETTEPYFYIHRHYAGWHVGWNGAGTDHHFTGSITTDGYFEEVEPFELEQYPDVLEVADSRSRIDLDTWTRSGEDGCDFVVRGATFVRFDLLIDETPRPERVFVVTGSIGLERETAGALPLTLEVEE